jgi:preprotein translocase subunit SecE
VQYKIEYHFNLDKKRNNMAGIVNYIKESFGELKNNVTWPTWAEAQSLTVLVAVFSIIFSLAIWGVDTVFSKVIAAYFQWING